MELINDGFSVSADAAKNRSLQLDFNGEIAENLNLSYAYTDAKTIRASLDLNFYLALPAGKPPCQPSAQPRQRASGQRL